MRKTSVLEQNEVVVVQRPLLTVGMYSARIMDKLIYNKFKPKSDGSFRIRSAHLATLTFDKNEIPSTVMIDGASHSPQNDTSPQKADEKIKQQRGKPETAKLCCADEAENETLRAVATGTEEPEETKTKKRMIGHDAKGTMVYAIERIEGHTE